MTSEHWTYFNVQQDIVFLKGWEDTQVFKYENNSVVTLLELSLCQPRGIYHTVNGNLLKSMRSFSHKVEW